MSEVKWIKLSTDIFDNRKIRQIEKMPDGDAIIVIWLKLLILAGDVNDGGLVYFTKEIPYTEQLLATQFDRPLAVVQFALKTFEQFSMIEIVDNLICVSNWEKYQNVESLDRIREQNRLRQKKWYDKQKTLPNVRPTLSNGTDKDTDKDKEKEKKDKTAREVLDDFCIFDSVKQALLDFEQMRKKMKSPMTGKAMCLLVNKLRELSADEETQLAIINQSIMNGWKSVYPLDERRSNASGSNPASTENGAAAKFKIHYDN